MTTRGGERVLAKAQTGDSDRVTLLGQRRIFSLALSLTHTLGLFDQVLRALLLLPVRFSQKKQPQSVERLCSELNGGCSEGEHGSAALEGAHGW